MIEKVYKKLSKKKLIINKGIKPWERRVSRVDINKVAKKLNADEVIDPKIKEASTINEIENDQSVSNSDDVKSKDS